MARYTDPVTQYNDDSGDPLVGGLLYFYESGTTTFKDTYTDSDFNTKNSNPVVLGGAGRIPSIFLDGNYRVVLTTSNGLSEQIWERDPVFGSTDAGQFSDWDILVTYNKGDAVKASDGNYYQSITDGNLGNDPTTSAAEWEQIFFITVWNTNQTYGIGAIAQYDGALYESLVASNIGNQPNISPSEWESLVANEAVNVSYDNSTTGLSATTVQDAIDETLANKRKNLLINAQGRINQRQVSGTVALAAGEYGHDRIRGGSGGGTYTFSTSGGVTTFTITADTLEQEIEGSNVHSGDVVLSWTGEAEAQIDGGGFSASPVTATVVGGTDVTVEFDSTGAGTFSLPQLEYGASKTDFDYLNYQDELAICQRTYEKSYDYSVTPGTIDSNGAEVLRLGAADVQDIGVRFKVQKSEAPTVTVYSPATGNSDKVDGQTTTNIDGSANLIGENGFKGDNDGTQERALTFHWVAEVL